MTNYRYWLLIASSGWSFVFAVSSQMTHLVANITPGSARSCMIQSAFLTHETVSNISTILSWCGIISSSSFLPFVLLLLVIIVAVVGVDVMVVVIIVAVVVIVKSSSVVKLSFVIT
ncbi:hypothetical protein Tco_0749039 [Tanacetum coccineum]|uniref:Uncharacterized protein n=1 Tax=Tanacetum coccineum TaxID=301880 RepID=A0ABQ4YXD2_9ASTR